MPASPPVPPTSIFKMQLQLNVRLSPYFSRNVRVGVENLLNKALLRHVPEAGGILLAYENLQLADQAAKIVHEGCEAHFRIRCDALVFRVRRGTLLAGTVNKISSNHIGLLVYGLFNASIAVDELRYGLRFDTESGGAWVEDSAVAAFGEGGGGSDSDDSSGGGGGGSPAAGDTGASSSSAGGPRVQFKAGTKMLFQVQGLRSNAGLVSIAGTMRLADAHKAAAAALEQREAKRQAKDDARARIAAARAEKVAAAAASAAAAIDANAPSEEEDAEAAAVPAGGSGGGDDGDDDDDDDDDDEEDDARTPRKKKAKAHSGDGGSGSGSSARAEKKKDKKKKKKDKKKKRDKSEKKPKKRKHASD